MVQIEEQIIAGVRSLPPEKQQEVLDFVEFLQQRSTQKLTLLELLSGTTEQSLENGLDHKRMTLDELLSGKIEQSTEVYWGNPKGMEVW